MAMRLLLHARQRAGSVPSVALRPILSAPSDPATAPPAAPTAANQPSESDPLLSHSALSPWVRRHTAAATAPAPAPAPFALTSTPLLSTATLIGGNHVYSSHVYSHNVYSTFGSTASAAAHLYRSLQSHVAPISSLSSRFLSSVPPLASQASESASDSAAEPAAPGSGLPAEPAVAGSEERGEGKEEDTSSSRERDSVATESSGAGSSSSSSSNISSSTATATTSSNNSSSGSIRGNRFSSSNGERRTSDGGPGFQAGRRGPRQRGARQTGDSRDPRKGQLWGVLNRLRGNAPVMPAFKAWQMAGGALDKELLLWAISRCNSHVHRRKAAELSDWLITSSRFPLISLDYQIALSCAARCNAVETVRAMFLSFPKEFQTEKVYFGVLHHFAKRGRTYKLMEELEWLRNLGVTEENASFRAKLQGVLTQEEITVKGFGWRALDGAETSEGEEERGGEEEGGGGEGGEGEGSEADWHDAGEGKEGFRKERLEQVLEVVDQTLLEMKEKGLMPDEVAYNIILTSLSRLGQIEKMESYLARMRADGAQPTIVTYNILIGAYALAGQFEKADLCLEAMKEEGERPNRKTYWSLLGRYANRGAVERFFQVWEELKQTGMALDRSMYHSRIEVHSRAGDLEKAEQSFNELCALMPPTTASFNVLIATLGRAGKVDKIPAVLKSMEQWGMQRDSKTYIHLIQAYLAAGDEESAMRVLREAAAIGVDRMHQKLPFSAILEVLLPARESGDVVRVKELIGLSRTLYRMIDPRLFRDLIVTIVNRWEKEKKQRGAGEEGGLSEREEDPSWKRLVSDVRRVLVDMRELEIEPTRKTLQILESLDLFHLVVETARHAE
ncbi:hypothetical protein CLOM_g20401 [Closterium sp. NIES-68]|nr:hypothetical protein CLOM_g20401 [Closterium sp. NIES-68]GJP81693.1 hypothetical protein CLOP_g11834 [Closterium sp. NIES-67]